jgi:K+:H+ antiporter
MLNVASLILQMTVVLVACRLVGDLFLKIGQPRVNGEVFAGILLGPSLLGAVAPHLSSLLFPTSSLVFLNAFGELGIVVFMFRAGLEFDPKTLRGRGRVAVTSSVASIVAPFLLAYPLAIYLYPRVSSPDVNFFDFALFLGAATSMTAFPMTTRVLSERNLLATRMGAITVACAVSASVIAWCLLSYVVMLIKGSHGGWAALWTFGGLFALAVLMIGVLKPLLQRLETAYRERGALNDRTMAMLMIVVLAAGACTGYLGLHPLFGAFLVGVTVPKENRLVQYIIERLDVLTLSLLLPLFFAYLGLRTNIQSLANATAWCYCGIIIVVAILGKLVAPMLTAWASGLPLRESAGMGALLNNRGLISMVVFSIGLDLKVISVAVFTMLVIMALFNTVITTWCLDLFCPKRFLEIGSPLEPEFIGLPTGRYLGAEAPPSGD